MKKLLLILFISLGLIGSAGAVSSLDDYYTSTCTSEQTTGFTWKDNAWQKVNFKAGKSAQLKSAVILGGLNSYGITTIIEDERSRDHTENMLIQNKHVIKIKTIKKKKIQIYGKKYLKPVKILVPNDPSSAAFFTALTLLKKNSSLRIKNVGLNPTRIGFYQLLKKHKAKIQFINLKKKKQ